MTDVLWPSDFGPVPLPSKFKPDDRWKSQLEIAHNVVELFETNDVVFLQAPTGTGKTLIGELVRRLMGREAVYSCSTKALQDQFANDFSYAKVLKGRSNYLPQLVQSGAVWEEATCADCNWDFDSGECSWCASRSMCPYVIARTRAEHSPLAVLNSSYLLTDFTKGKGRFAGRNLYIIDEADVLEDELLKHIEVSISRTAMARMGLASPAKKTVASSWVTWVNEVAEPGIRAYLARLPGPASNNPDHIREYKRTEDLLERVKVLKAEIGQGGWVYDGYGDGAVIFRPIHVNKFGDAALWSHAGDNGKFLLMSATILSADLMAEELGLCYNKDRYFDTIDLPSEFPVENRPVHVVPIANMRFKDKPGAWPKMLEGVKGVLRLHPDDRVLVHTVSYELAKYIERGLTAVGVQDDERLRRPIITYTSSIQKNNALSLYKDRRRSVLIASSMDRGIDLPDDMCRVQVIAKIPYPNTADKRINARMYSRGGNAWYQMQTVRKIVQMTGRGVRSKDDHATTYILDAQFGENLYSRNKYLFPQWWADSLNWRFNPRKLTK